jgi:hypothetical protein
MTGFRSKQASATSRFADDLTVAELVRLRNDNDRFRSALEKICDAYLDRQDDRQLFLIARAALKGEK